MNNSPGRLAIKVGSAALLATCVVLSGLAWAGATAPSSTRSDGNTAVDPASPVVKDPDCTLDAAGLEPKLADIHKDFAGKVTRDRSRGLVETVELRGGGTLTLSQYGCAHYGLTYLFSLVPDTTPLSNRKHAVERAAHLLLRPLGPRNTELNKVLAGTLLEKARTWPPGEQQDGTAFWGKCNDTECVSDFSCGDATCGVAVKRVDKKLVSILITYDFPL